MGLNKKSVDDIEQDIQNKKVKSENQIRALEFLINNEGVIIWDLETFADITYIASDNAVKPTLSFKVSSNLAGTVQQNAKSVNELYKLIDGVIIPQLMNNATDIQLLKLK